MFGKCAEGMNGHSARAAISFFPANLNATGDVGMIGKNLIPKRGVMIAVAVIALMTLTAGVAAAASMKAKFDAAGSVSSVGLEFGAVVDSKFKIKHGDIKSIKIKTIGESVGGDLTSTSNCTGACAELDAALLGDVTSVHESKVTLKVTFQPGDHPDFPHLAGIEVIGGNLRGKLKAKLTISGSEGDLTGKANLKIKGTATSYYACLVGAGFGTIQDCIDAPGPHSFAVQLTGGPAVGPVLIPIDLHVKDSGNFKVENESTKITGKIVVTVDDVIPLVVPATGVITVTKGKAKFSID